MFRAQGAFSPGDLCHGFWTSFFEDLWICKILELLDFGQDLERLRLLRLVEILFACLIGLGVLVLCVPLSLKCLGDDTRVALDDCIPMFVPTVSTCSQTLRGPISAASTPTLSYTYY